MIADFQDLPRTEVKLQNFGTGNMLEIDAAWLEVRNEDLIAIRVQFEQKHVELDGTGSGMGEGPSVMFSKDDDGLCIEFTEFDSTVWEVFAVQVNRYTANICLKRIKP